MQPGVLLPQSRSQHCPGAAQEDPLGPGFCPAEASADNGFVFTQHSLREAGLEQCPDCFNGVQGWQR